MLLALVEELGEKVTPKVKLCPRIRDSGRLSPLRLQGAPWAMARLEPPELVTVLRQTSGCCRPGR